VSSEPAWICCGLETRIQVRGFRDAIAQTQIGDRVVGGIRGRRVGGGRTHIAHVGHPAGGFESHG